MSYYDDATYREVRAFGCLWYGRIEHDPGQPYPSYSCAGVPPSWHVEVLEVSVEDADDLGGYTPFEDTDEKTEERIMRYIERCVQRNRALHSRLQEHLIEKFEHSVEEELLRSYNH